ncbi:MAG: ABC transporter substrate-binding protein [Anaerolineales bacterium]|nr:ABC transporter substrate-binding protein [Anaerolineales bacterium]
MKRTTLFGIALVLSFSLILGACAPAQPPLGDETGEVPAESAAEEPQQAPVAAEPVTLKIAVLPIMDALPMFVAESEGLFEANGVNVEFIPVASAPERAQIMQAGQADGTVNEILSVMFFNKESVQMQAVRFAHKATPEHAHFYILAAGSSGITDVAGLKGVDIGVSQGTIIEYLTYRLLEAEGFSADEISTLAVPRIPDRLALLGSGEMQAGVLPDPLGPLAEQSGAVTVLDDRNAPNYGASVISFRSAVIEENPEAIQAFLVAIEEAVTRINANPSQYTGLLAEKKLVPPPLMESYQIPIFPTAGVPSEADWNDALDWAQSQGLLDVDVAYSDSINADLLP